MGESTDRCLGVVAYCPAGTVPNPSDAEDCLRVCPGGKVEVASGHCCWPGQIWRKETGVCAGRPKCPPEMVPDPRNPMECLRSCTGGRLEIAPGHCCRPGETWHEDAQKCAGAATCPAGTLANPRNVAECLRPCPGDRVEVAPGHCCWPGQAWNVDSEECEGRAVACTAHMRLATGACVPIDGPCQTSADCSDDSLCLAGRCEPGHRFRRVEVFADGVPVVLGYWRSSHSGGYPSSPIARGDFSLRGAAGLAVRVSRSIHPRWSFGGYLGYLRAVDGQVDDVRTDYPETVPAVVELSTVRIGGLGNCRWGRRRGMVYGLGVEAGFVFGTARAGDWDWGGEIAPDFFLDVPLGSGRSRSFLTFSLGFRAGLIEYSRVPGYGTAIEDWYYFMPLLRLGVGTGH